MPAGGSDDGGREGVEEQMEADVDAVRRIAIAREQDESPLQPASAQAGHCYQHDESEENGSQDADIDERHPLPARKPSSPGSVLLLSMKHGEGWRELALPSCPLCKMHWDS